jgi:hypothetical protein
MSRYGVNVQKFVVISNPEEAIEAAKSLSMFLAKTNFLNFKQNI